MSMEIGEVFIDYELLADLIGAYRERVFETMGSVDENEERHVSELNRRMVALDEKEVYIALAAFYKHHRGTVIKALKYLKEGECK